MRTLKTWCDRGAAFDKCQLPKAANLCVTEAGVKTEITVTGVFTV